MTKVGEDLVNFLYDSIPERDYVFGAIPGFGGSGVNSGSLRFALVNVLKTEKEPNRKLQKIYRENLEAL